MRAALVLALAVAAGAPGLRPGYGGQAQPTFRASTSLVEVDIIARDKDGRFVSGLSADDFEVLEEGKPQQVQHFYLVTGTDRASRAAGFADPVEPRPPGVIPRSPDRIEGRVFVFFFDSRHLSAGTLLRLKQHASDFIKEHLGPGDLAGVFVNGSLAGGHLTNDRRELIDAIKKASPASDTNETRAQALVEYPRIGSYFDAQRIDSGDRTALEEAAAENCGGETARQCTAEGGREFVEDKLQRKAQTFINESRHAAASTLQSMQYVIKNLSRLEGRKTLVLISEGFYVEDARSSLPLVAGQASRAGITIYSLDARGTNARGGVASGDVTMQAGGLSGFGDTTDEGLDVLAAETGGLTVRHTDDFSRALAGVESDTSTYYVLAYSPENTKMDGKYRKIQLKVKWQGLDVRARHGYVASPLPTPGQLRRQ